MLLMPSQVDTHKQRRQAHGNCTDTVTEASFGYLRDQHEIHCFS